MSKLTFAKYSRPTNPPNPKARFQPAGTRTLKRAIASQNRKKLKEKQRLAKRDGGISVVPSGKGVSK